MTKNFSISMFSKTPFNLRKSLFMKNLLLALFTLMISSGMWGQKIKTGTSAAYIAPNGFGKDQFEISSGVFVFDATMRMGISNIYKTSEGEYVFKYLGEEQPDAIYETLKDFVVKATVQIKNEKADAEVLNNINNLVKNLTEKSRAHTFLRSSLYRINEAAFNQDISDESYKELFLEIIRTAKEIQLKELEK